MADTTRRSAKTGDRLLDERSRRRTVQGDRSVCRVEGAGVTSSDESCRTRVASRRTVLGWAATAVGLAVCVQVANAPTAQAVSSPAPPLRQERAGARVDPAVEAKAPRNTVALTIDDGPHPSVDAQGARPVGCERRACHVLVDRAAGAGVPGAGASDRRGRARSVQSLDDPSAAVRGPQHGRDPPADRRRAVGHLGCRRPGAAAVPGPGRRLDARSARPDRRTPADPRRLERGPRDWTQPGIGTIESSLLRARAGDILLTHDGGGNRAQTVAALKAVLTQLRRRGFGSGCCRPSGAGTAVVTAATRRAW